MRGRLSEENLLRRLVGFESVSCRGNLSLADFVCDILDGSGAEITRIDSADGTKTNVVARVGPVDDGAAGLTLSGHLDVVPADEPGWQSDPFTLVERNGCYVGRGACDMKGFIAVALDLLLTASDEHPARPLALLLSYDEELGSLGVQRLARSWGERPPLPRAVVIGEPTSLKVVRMHKGHLTMRITIAGRAAHSGSPHLGMNAIEPAGPLISRLNEVARTWHDERMPSSEHFPAVPHPVLTIARIRGGEALNVVPDSCAIDVGIRLLPGQDSSAAAEEIRSIVRSVLRDDRATVVVLNDNPPMLLREDAPIHAELRSLVGQRDSVGVSFASDAGVLSREMGMQCVLFGPGSIEAAHRANESLATEEIRRARDVLGRLIRARCFE